jgi:hypothetical protein
MTAANSDLVRMYEISVKHASQIKAILGFNIHEKCGGQMVAIDIAGLTGRYRRLPRASHHILILVEQLFWAALAQCQTPSEQECFFRS